MKKARKKRIVRRKRRISEREIMRIKRKLKKSARKLRLGAKRTGAYVYGTLRRIVGNPYTADQRRRIVEAINECNAYIRKESARRADIRPREAQEHLDFCRAHKQKLLKMLGYDVAERYLKGNPGDWRTWGYSLRDIDIGKRVELSSATDWWMRGARFGTVVGKTSDRLKVKLDRYPKVVLISPKNIQSIVELGRIEGGLFGNRRIRRNEEYARQIPRISRPMRARGFSKGFDFSAGSEYKHLQNFLATGRPAGMKWERKIGANTLVRRYNDGSIGVILYSTRILHYHPNGEVDVNFGGYMTPTTFSRINALVPYGWQLRKKGGKLALENSWGQRAVIRKPRAGEEYAVRLTEDKAYLIT